MNNIQIIQTRPEIINGWVVKADTERFGENEIMFEGSYDQCANYVAHITFVVKKGEPSTVYITGYKDGAHFDHDWLSGHRDEFIEQDWAKVLEPRLD